MIPAPGDSRPEEESGEPLGTQSDDASASEIIDMERAQIGHDLHDLLLPLIFAASANLQPLADGRAGEAVGTLSPALIGRLEQSIAWLEEAQTLGRRLLTQIYPAELESLTFLAAAKDAAERLCEDGCEVTWEIAPDCPLCSSDCPRDMAAVAYRVLVESIRNAVRHGQASSITVKCSTELLSVVDDGSGFDPNAVPANRFGIRSMKGRARLIGQSLTVDSRPGGPTNVRLTLA